MTSPHTAGGIGYLADGAFFSGDALFSGSLGGVRSGADAYRGQIEAVRTVLDRLELGRIPELLVVNQIDKLPSGVGESIAKRHRGVAVSALQKIGLRELLKLAEEI